MQKVLIAAIVTLGIFLLIFLLLPLLPHKGDKYDRLQIGMARMDVAKLFQAEPDFSFALHDAIVSYYLTESPWCDEIVRSEQPQLIASVKQLPDCYDAIQVMFDQSGKVVAFTWNGEELDITTAPGSVPGANISLLGDDVVGTLLTH